MVTVYDVPAEPLILRVAETLKGNDAVKAPEWAAFVTTGVHAEKPPVQKDWWQIRAAAVLRKVYIMGPIGTERLRSEFGGARDRGAKPDRAAKGSGSVIRECLQQLQTAGFVENVKGEGRRITPAGQKLMDNAAFEVRKTLAETIPALQKY